jgi:hypothetical protein
MIEVALVLALSQAPASACGISDEPEFATTKEHAVQVGGGAMYVGARERRYLDVLRGPMGEPVQYKRLGSLPGGDERTILDRYEVTYPGLEKPIYLFLDAYHYDDALKAPKGFTCTAPIGLMSPGPDSFLAMEAMLRLAIERTKREVAPVSLDADGSSTHGVLFDRFRMQVRAARAAAASGTPLDLKRAGREMAMGMVIVAYPLKCGDDKPPVTAGAIEIVPAQGLAPTMTGVLATTAPGLAHVLPDAALPPGSAAATFQLERPRPIDAIKISYPASACGAATEVSLPMKYTGTRPLNTPSPTLPAGHPQTDRPVLLQAMIDLDGTVQQVVYVGGPPALASAAIEAVRGWTAEPATLNGSAIVTPALFQVRFNPR